MIPSPEIKTDKTIIIGFTGPIGSGCTTLSKFFADELYEDEKGIMHFLIENNYITDKDNINHNLLDSDIKDLYNSKTKYESDLKSAKKSDKVKQISEKLKSLHYKLKNKLEEREYTNSLDYILDKEYYKNRLRISCSSILIFEMIRIIKNKNIYIIPEDIKNIFKDFYNNLISIINKERIDTNLFNIVYDEINKIFHHKENAKRYGDPPFETNEIEVIFNNISIIKKQLSLFKNYRELFQDFGDNFRSTGNPFHYPNPKWIDDNKKEFRKNNDIIARYIDYIIHFHLNSKKDIKLFLIDGFRNPFCIDYLRKRYPRFYLISVFASKNIRKERIINKLKQKGLPFNKKEFELQDNRDKGDHIRELYDQFYMQNVDKTVQLSDIAINNERDKNNLFESILRYLALIFDPGCTKPTGDEMFMNMAYSMALKSNCISRQVGAVIEGKDGYVVGAGWNDVGEGQISCGLRIISDLENYQFKCLIDAINDKSNEQKSTDQIIKEIVDKYGELHYCFCFKDELTNAISKSEIKKVSDIIKATDNYDISKNKECIDDILIKFEKEVKFKGLQYCKALHAEENAIIQGSKIGGMGLVGGKIYTTTFPCELCAKKIQQVGIEEVIYVEPYPKSISEDVYLQDGIRKVKTRQFEGVKGLGYYKLFKSFYDQKDWQFFEKSGYVD